MEHSSEALPDKPSFEVGRAKTRSKQTETLGLASLYEQATPGPRDAGWAAPAHLCHFRRAFLAGSLQLLSHQVKTPMCFVTPTEGP